MTQYMVIETFFENCLEKVYERFHERGRMLPDGLHYLDSWLTKDRSRCFQLMETEKIELLQEWARNWEDLTQFEIVEIGEKPEKRGETQSESGS
jgi:hypothetical protein